MEATMKKFITFFLCAAIWVSISFSQDLQIFNTKQMLFKSTNQHQGVIIDLSNYKSPKKPGHYTTEDWRALIDSLWGPGLPTSTKLEIFDSFWNDIDQHWAGFPYLEVNWDSMKALYRPEVEAGVSRGRFWAIIGQLFLSLQEIHTWIIDLSLDSLFLENGQIVYKPGIPAFFTSGWGWAGNFGAALTPLPDSSLLVYRAINPHPLGIVPGDIILGYDRIPWKKLYKDLLLVELPLQWSHESRWGSSPRSMSHALLNSAGKNWGLFDTLDVLKYETDDTLHLSTAPLIGLDWFSLFATEQVAVPGVQMPDYGNGECVTWGVVDNTSIGYVYVYRWNATEENIFATAMKDLVTVKNVTGIILDFRYNLGSGDSDYASDAGLDYLFNENPAGALHWRNAWRSDPANHLTFTYSNPWDSSATIKPDYYDRPIAVLTGPQSFSFGDLNTFKMRFHPMVRFFGLPTNGAFVVPGSLLFVGSDWGSWYYMYAPAQMYSLCNNEGFLLHKGFPVDEELWLTRDDVAKEEDTVVKRAIEWINNLSYAYDVIADHLVISPDQDTVSISAIVENPNQHPITVLSVFTNDSNAVIDSIYLYDDGLHHDGAAVDKVWANTYIYTKNIEQTIHVCISTNDPIDSDTRNLTNAVQFTSIGPLVLDSISNISTDKEVNAGDLLRFKFTVSNEGKTATALNVFSYAVPLDTCAAIKTTAKCVYGNLEPGATYEASNSQSISFNKNCAGQTAWFALDIYSNNYHFWSDTFSIYINPPSGIESVEDIIVKEFDLKQNYPNPFNPSTTIKFQIPNSNFVTLGIYNLLGQKVATLVNKKLNAGIYTAEWNAAGFASGVYLYRLQAGNYTETKKLILLR